MLAFSGTWPSRTAHDNPGVMEVVGIDRALSGSTPGRGDQWLDKLLLRIREIARIAQLVTFVAVAVLDRPHRAPRGSLPTPHQAACPSARNRFN